MFAEGGWYVVLVNLSLNIEVVRNCCILMTGKLADAPFCLKHAYTWLIENCRKCSCGLDDLTWLVAALLDVGSRCSPSSKTLDWMPRVYLVSRYSTVVGGYVNVHKVQ